MIKFPLILVTTILTFSAFSQNTSVMKSKRKDSTARQPYEYNHVFPILGKKLAKRGIDFPHPYGISGTTYYQDAYIDITSIGVGFSGSRADIPVTDISDLLKFPDSRAYGWVSTLRPDLWLFPFLNVYGIFGYGQTNTDINMQIVNPNTGDIWETFNLDPVRLKGYSAGVGVLGAFGFEGWWLSVDFNFNWAFLDLLEAPTMVNNLSFRFGHKFPFKNKEHSSISIWVGAFRQGILTERTVGNIGMEEIFGGLADEQLARLADVPNQDWYQDLGSVKQGIVDEIVAEIDHRLSEGAWREGTITYDLAKQTAKKWNLLVGMQYEINKAWQLRAEGGWLAPGYRWQALFGFNYRFNFKGKSSE